MTSLTALAVAFLISVGAPASGVLSGAGAAAGTTPVPGMTGAGGSVGVTIAPSTAGLRLGDEVDLTVTVDNATGAATSPLVVHLDVTDPDLAGSVDPEDWTTTLSKPVGVLAPGQTRVVDWHLQPVSAGSFTVYAVALSAGEEDVAVSGITTIDVTDRRSLNPGNVLAVAVTVPGLVGAVLLFRLRRPRRNRPIRTDDIMPGP
jgi:hypothetical protein